MASAVEYSSLPPYGRASSRSPSHFAAARRPWRELLAHPSSYSFPHGSAYFVSRFRRNLSHFRVNYAMIVLLVLFLSLIYHPISMIVFVVAIVFWFLFYFSRDEPIVVCGRMVDDRVVLLVLAVLTAGSLVLTRVWVNVVAAVAVGGVVVVLHAVFRVAEDLFLDEDEVVDGGLASVVGARF